MRTQRVINIYVSDLDAKVFVKGKEIAKRLTGEFGVPVSLSKYVVMCVKEGNEKRKDR